MGVKRFVPVAVKRAARNGYNRFKGLVRAVLMYMLARARKLKYAFMGSRLSYRVPFYTTARPGGVEARPGLLSPNFSPGANLSETCRRVYGEFFPERVEPIVRLAGMALENRISFFEFEDAPIGTPVDWHADIRSGKGWPSGAFHTEINYVRFDGSDVKTPWEIARFQHLIPVVKAFALTGDARCARKFAEQVNDWLDANPYPRGIHWACPMEVAIRAINWMFARFALNACGGGDRALEQPLMKSLYLHGYHTIRNLEGTRHLHSNHYLSDIMGLLALGACLPGLRESGRWLAKGRAAIVEEMFDEVYADGADFEASTLYHCLALDLFTVSACVCRNAGIELPPAFWERLEKMFGFLFAITKPNGRLPQFGDNDSGRVLNFTDAVPTDRRQLIPVGAMLFGRRDWRTPLTPPSEDLFWLMGEGAVREYASWPESPRPAESAAFENCGLYLMRDEDLYLLISCGPNGQKGGGGHAHNDKLSFELNWRGADIFVDPGTYLYTPYPEWRNLFRSTAMHNTVTVDGQEQNRLIDGSLFWMIEDTHPRALRFDAAGPEKVFAGEHDGYERLSGGVTHRRTFAYSAPKGEVEIVDEMTAKGAHEYETRFHLDPGVSVSTKGNAVEISAGGKLSASLEAHNGPAPVIEDTWFSRHYGHKEPAKAVLYRRRAEGNAEMRYRVKLHR